MYNNNFTNQLIFQIVNANQKLFNSLSTERVHNGDYPIVVDYPMWAFFQVTRYVADIQTLISVNNYISPSIHGIRRMMIEVYADVLNFSELGYNYVAYLNFLNSYHSLESHQASALKELMELLSVGYVNRRTRYYLISRSERNVNSDALMQSFNTNLSKLDRQYSMLIHNNYTEYSASTTEILDVQKTIFWTMKGAVTALSKMRFYANIIPQEYYIEVVHLLDLLGKQVFFCDLQAIG